MAHSSEERAVYVYARPVPSAPDRRDEILARLRDLHDERRIDAVRTWTWPKEVTRSPSRSDDAIDVFQRFERWADQGDLSVRPPFRWTTRASTITGDCEDVLVTPELCLAVRDDGTLVGVFPSTDGETHYGIDEGIAALEAGTLPRAFDTPLPLTTTPGQVIKGEHP